MDTAYNKLIPTTDEDHEKQLQKIFKKLYDQGDIYKGYYEGMYCTPCESFFTESQLVDGKCKDGESRLSEILQRIPGRSEKGSDAERDERKMIEHGSRAAQQA